MTAFPSSFPSDRSVGGNVLFPDRPAFLAYKSARDGAGVTGDGTTATIVFNTESFDRGGNYDNTTGIFTAPVTGLYWFSTVVESLGYDGAHTYSLLELVTTSFNARLDGRIFGAGKINSLVGGNQWDSRGSICVSLTAGNTAKVTLSAAGSALTVLGEGAAVPRTFFCGALIA